MGSSNLEGILLSPGYTIESKKPAQLDFDGKNFILVPPRHPALEVQVETGARWDRSRRVWVVPNAVIYAQRLREMYPNLPITDAAQARIDWSITPPRAFHLSPSTAPVWNKLYPYQKIAVTQLVSGIKPGQMSILSPGLGKTVVALLAARILKAEKVLVVCIKDLMQQWCDEEQKWFGESTFDQLHQQPPKPPLWPSWYVANYETVVGRLHPDFLRGNWDAVIIDESVLVKNRNTRRFKNLLKLRPHAKRWWELTGSPTTRYADDLYAQLRLCDPKAFTSYWRFTRRYCYLQEDVWGVQVIGSRQDKDPILDLPEYVFRRNQKDVLSSLPQEIPQLVPVSLTKKQSQAYREMNSQMVTTLSNGQKVETTEVIAQLTRLQQITSNLCNIGGEDESAKADALVSLIAARAFEMPALIWVNWVPGARALLERLRSTYGTELRIEYIRGADSKQESEENNLKFQEYKAGKIDLLLLSLPVGKFGQNLQNSKTAVYYDKTFQADDFVQSLHRIKRIGLQHRPLIITLKARRTVEELIEDNLAGKLPSIAQISSADLASMLGNLTGIEQ